MSILEFKNVSVFLQSKEIVRDITFTISQKQFVSLLGPNGAGKTTLLKAAAGLIPYEGSILLNGQEINEIKPSKLGRVLSYIPQVHEVHWPMLVKDLVGLGRLPFHFSSSTLNSDDLDAINSALEMTDLIQYADHRFDHLSGGEKNRVMIARALATHPHMLLADEPTAALDPYHQLHTLEVLRKHIQKGFSIIAILHDINLAAQFSDHTILLNKGQIVEQGTPEKVLTEKNLRNIYNISFSQNILLSDGIWKRADV